MGGRCDLRDYLAPGFGAHMGRGVSVRPLGTASTDAFTMVYIPFKPVLRYNFSLQKGSSRGHSHRLGWLTTGIIVPGWSRSLSWSLFLPGCPVDIGLVGRVGEFVVGSRTDEVFSTACSHIVRRVRTTRHRTSKDDPTRLPSLDTGLSCLLASSAGRSGSSSGNLRSRLCSFDSLHATGRPRCIHPECCCSLP